MVGTVTSLQVQETLGEVVRVTWVGVQGATAYRVSWRRMDGRSVAGHFYTVVSLVSHLVCVSLIMKTSFKAPN